jgi:hypothetical protein
VLWNPIQRVLFVKMGVCDAIFGEARLVRNEF